MGTKSCQWVVPFLAFSTIRRASARTRMPWTRIVTVRFFSRRSARSGRRSIENMVPYEQHCVNHMPRSLLRKVIIAVCVFFALVALLVVLIGAILVRRGTPAATPESSAAQFTALRNDPVPSVVPAEATARLLTDDDPFMGPRDARVTIVEFGDFECPFCLQAFPIIRELMAVYSDRVRFIYRDFPVSEIHSSAQKAAEAGECAHAQEKFWPMHDKLFQNAPRFSNDALKGYARAIGLDGAAFDQCLMSGRFTQEVAQDREDGLALGVRGTPTWFINGRKVEAVIPHEVFGRALERLLTLP